MSQTQERCAVIVHGEPSSAAAMAEALRAIHLAVDVAVDAQAAMERVADNPPDVVCISLNLPRDSGYDLCEQIRSRPALNHVRVLIWSDRHSPDIVAHAEEAGADAFLPWPFEPELLVSCVGTLLGLPRPVRSGALRRWPDEVVTLE
jgi:DNA-binding response OmpR family regulator